MLKLAMIGSRGHCQYVFERPQPLHEYVERIAICSGCEDKLGRLFDLPKSNGYEPVVYDDWQKMLEQEKPDVVCIDGPFQLHAAMCKYAMERGIHVFCEKPMALNLEELEEVRRTLAAHPVHFTSMTALRYDPAMFFAHSIAESGRIGEIMLVQTRKSYKLATRPAFYSQRATYGGTIGWVGSHAFDWIQWFTHDQFATVSATQHRMNNNGNGTMEMAAQCLFTMKHGALAQASIDFFRPANAPTWGDDRVRAVGTRGVVEVAEGKVILTGENGREELSVPEQPRTIFADFLREICGEGSTLTGVEETFALTRACILAQQAADEKQIKEF